MSRALPPLQYNHARDSALRQALNQAAQDYLTAHQDHRYANWGMGLKLVILVLAGVGFYLAALYQHTLLGFFICYLLFISTAMLLAVNVVHDASHNVFLKSPRANAWLNSVVTIPLGIDPDCWRIRHVEQHHQFNNIEYYDLDIDYNGFLRQTPFQIHHWFMRYQHYYWPVIAGMTFPTIIWCFDWQDRLGVNYAKTKFTHQGIRGWGIFLTAKLAHVSLTLIVPMLLCPQFSPWLILLIYVLSQMGSSLIFVVLILGSHWAKGTFYQAPKDLSFTQGKTEHIFNTTLNWRLKSPYLEYWLGGLNLHLTHHIYPGFSHRHYYQLTLILQKVAQHYGAGYQEISLRELFKYQQVFLRAMGKQPSNNKMH